ncbi:HAAS signaling domain-containing protein [Lysobacter sp. F6437]|uniref:HAAS signaling domain-containing protein n=1 Tax=Lysobacter sp. F6437 TaxID=3459296 RepID=UPI00403DB156
MARSEVVHQYLSDLERYLSRLSEARAQEIVQEIESHIYDAMELLQPAAGEGGAEAILGRLGTPRELAAGYIDHLNTGVAPPRGLKPLSRVRKGISKSFYYLVCCLGYGTAIALLAAAALKLLSPASLGVWVAEHGNSVVVSFSQHDPRASELPAAWLVPLAALAGAGLLYLTHRVARILKMHVWNIAN